MPVGERFLMMTKEPGLSRGIAEPGQLEATHAGSGKRFFSSA
jgi:hypothetical protein